MGVDFVLRYDLYRINGYEEFKKCSKK